MSIATRTQHPPAPAVDQAVNHDDLTYSDDIGQAASVDIGDRRCWFPNQTRCAC